MRVRIYHTQAGVTIIQAFEEDADYFKIGDRFDLIFVGRTLYLEKSPTGSVTCTAPSKKDLASVYSRLCSRVMPNVPAFHVD